MSGERGLDRELRRLGVADLADEDDVRVVAEDGAESRLEGEPGLRVHLDLIDVAERVLDRVFDGHDVAFVPVELVEARVQRRRLA